MANTMTSYVKIINLNKESHEKLVDLFQTKGETFDEREDLLPHLNKLYGTEFTDDNYLSVDWMNENIGSKWLRIEFGVWSTKNFVEETQEVDLIFESAWNVPTNYLEKLTEVLTEVNKDIVVYGTYEDEMYEPMGAFVYANDYDDIEDLDEEVEINDMIEDEEYRYEVMNDLYEHRDSLLEAYLEIKKEREEDENQEA
jgi:hypothetical protein